MFGEVLGCIPFLLEFYVLTNYEKNLRHKKGRLKYDCMCVKVKFLRVNPPK